MTSANRRPRHPLASVNSVVALLANYALAFVGAVVAMAGFVALVTAKSVKAFVKDHPYPLYIALVIAVLTISATLNYVRFLRRENARLTCLASRESPTSNDVRYFAGLMVDLPIDGAVMTWLKRTGSMSYASPTFRRTFSPPWTERFSGPASGRSDSMIHRSTRPLPRSRSLSRPSPTRSNSGRSCTSPRTGAVTQTSQPVLSYRPGASTAARVPCASVRPG